MPKLERSALLAHSAEDLYALVRDVERYPEFLPGCTGAGIEWLDEARIRAKLAFRVRGLADAFVTENSMVAGRRIDMRLVQGPFKRLDGHWEFVPLGGDASKVTLRLELEFGSRLLEMTLLPWLDRAVGTVLDAFVRRAGEMYGRG